MKIGGEKINYVMIPKQIIYDFKMDYRRVMVYTYFSSKRGLDDTVGFTVNYLIEWMGFVINRHKDGTNDTIRNLINQFILSEYFSINAKLIDANFYMPILNIEKFDCPDNFALVYFDELEKIRNFKKYTSDKSRINSSILLLVFSYLRVNMLRRQKYYIGDKSDKPEFCYRMYKDIEDEIKISTRHISNAVKVLEKLELISYKELPRYKDDNGNWHTSVTLFSDKYRRLENGTNDPEYDYRQELLWGEDYIKGKKYLNKKFYQDTF